MEDESKDAVRKIRTRIQIQISGSTDAPVMGSIVLPFLPSSLKDFWTVSFVPEIVGSVRDKGKICFHGA